MKDVSSSPSRQGIAFKSIDISLCYITVIVLTYHFLFVKVLKELLLYA
jgi:hypothetical protein